MFKVNNKDTRTTPGSFSFLNFYYLQVEIFLLKNTFVIYFLMKTLIFHKLFSIHNLELNKPWLRKNCKII